MTDWDGISSELSLSMYDNGRVVEDLGLGIEVKMRRLAGCVLYLNPPHLVLFFGRFFLNGVEMMENIAY